MPPSADLGLLASDQDPHLSGTSELAVRVTQIQPRLFQTSMGDSQGRALRDPAALSPFLILHSGSSPRCLSEAHTPLSADLRAPSLDRGPPGPAGPKGK